MKIILAWVGIMVFSFHTAWAIAQESGFPGVTELYTNSTEAIGALLSTNRQAAWNAYYSFAVIGKPAIPVLISHAYMTNEYAAFAHWSWHYSNIPSHTTIGEVCLYLVEAILHQCTHPHYAATLCSAKSGPSTQSRGRYDAQTNVASLYKLWWQRNCTSSIDLIRKKEINPLQGTQYEWEGYTQYMERAVLQLSE